MMRDLPVTIPDELYGAPVGFTGSRSFGDWNAPDALEAQCGALAQLLARLNPPEFHHGDCEGWDDHAARLVHRLRAAGGIRRNAMIWCHPPADETHRAFTTLNDRFADPLTYLSRNRAIVNASRVLVACPNYSGPLRLGGTSYTVGYARKHGMTVYVVRPGGAVECRSDAPESPRASTELFGR
jgi:hypothetical protein